MRGLSFIVAAVMAAQASADAMDNTLYYVAEPAYAAPPLTSRYVAEPQYVGAVPIHTTSPYAHSYPIGGRYIEVPEPLVQTASAPSLG